MQLTPFQQKVVNAAVAKLISGKHFDILLLRDLASIMGRDGICNTKDYIALKALHCMPYKEMGRETAAEVRAKALELLGLGG